MAYPTTIDTFPGTSTLGNTQLSDATDDHAAQHRLAGSALGTLEQVIGTTAGTAIAMNFKAGDFAARINSSNVPQQLFSSGTINNPIIGTPAITGGTANNQVVGTPAITGGTINSVIGTQTGNNLAANWINASNGTAVNIGSAAAPSAGQVVMATNGSAATWQPAINFLNIGTISSGTTASASPVDVTNVAGTINPTRAVTIKADITGRWYNDAASGNVDLYMLINGTIMQTLTLHPEAVDSGQGFALTAGTNLAAGAGTIKMQMDTSAGTAHVENIFLTAIYG